MKVSEVWWTTVIIPHLYHILSTFYTTIIPQFSKIYHNGSPDCRSRWRSFRRSWCLAQDLHRDAGNNSHHLETDGTIKVFMKQFENVVSAMFDRSYIYIYMYIYICVCVCSDFWVGWITPKKYQSVHQIAGRSSSGRLWVSSWTAGEDGLDDDDGDGDMLWWRQFGERWTIAEREECEMPSGKAAFLALDWVRNSKPWKLLKLAMVIYGLLFFRARNVECHELQPIGAQVSSPLRFAEDVDEANEAWAVDALSLWVAHKVCHLNSLSHFCCGLSPIHQTDP